MRPEASEQIKIFKEHVTNIQFSTSEYAYLISMKWLQKWYKSVGYYNNSQPTNDCPPIDNKDLVNEGDENRRVLMEGIHHIVVKKDMWDLFVKWYGGGPEIKVEVGFDPIRKQNIPDVHPLTLHIFYSLSTIKKHLINSSHDSLRPNNNRDINFTTMQFSKYKTADMLRNIICEKLQISPSKFSLFMLTSINEHIDISGNSKNHNNDPLKKSSRKKLEGARTLSEYHISNNQQLILDVDSDMPRNMSLYKTSPEGHRHNQPDTGNQNMTIGILKAAPINFNTTDPKKKNLQSPNTSQSNSSSISQNIESNSSNNEANQNLKMSESSKSTLLPSSASMMFVKGSKTTFNLPTSTSMSFVQSSILKGDHDDNEEDNEEEKKGISTFQLNENNSSDSGSEIVHHYEGSKGRVANLIPNGNPYESNFNTFADSNHTNTSKTQKNSAYLIHGPSQQIGLCGFVNLGNTCFFNSSLQSLLHTMPLINHFLNDHWKSEMSLTNKLGTKGACVTAFVSIVERVWAGLATSLAPRHLFGVIQRYAPHFSGYNQQDAHELLLFLLDMIHEDLNRVKAREEIKEREKLKEIQSNKINENNCLKSPKKSHKSHKHYHKKKNDSNSDSNENLEKSKKKKQKHMKSQNDSEENSENENLSPKKSSKKQKTENKSSSSENSNENEDQQEENKNKKNKNSKPKEQESSSSDDNDNKKSDSDDENDNDKNPTKKKEHKKKDNENKTDKNSDSDEENNSNKTEKSSTKKKDHKKKDNENKTENNSDEENDNNESPTKKKEHKKKENDSNPNNSDSNDDDNNNNKTTKSPTKKKEHKKKEQEKSSDSDEAKDKSQTPKKKNTKKVKSNASESDKETKVSKSSDSEEKTGVKKKEHKKKDHNKSNEKSSDSQETPTKKKPRKKKEKHEEETESETNDEKQDKKNQEEEEQNENNNDDVEEYNGNDEEYSARAWRLYKSHNDSIVVDTFHGLLRSKLRCPNCKSSAVMFDPFVSISLPITTHNQLYQICFVPYDVRLSQMNLTLPIPFNSSKEVFEASLFTEIGRTCRVIYAQVSESISVNNNTNTNNAIPKSLSMSALSSSNEFNSQNNNNNGMFVSYSLQYTSVDVVANPSPPFKSTKTYVFEVPNEINYCAIARLAVKVKGLVNSSVKHLNDLYIVEIPNESPSKEEVAQSCKKRFGYLWNNRSEKEIKKDIHKKVKNENFIKEFLACQQLQQLLKGKEIASFKKGDQCLKVKTNSYGHKFPRFKQNPIVSSSIASIIINGKFMNEASGFNYQLLFRPNSDISHISTQSHQHKNMSIDYSNKKKQSLDNLLKTFTSPTLLDEDNKWYCPKCKEFVCADKKLDIWSLPKCFIINFKRFAARRNNRGYKKIETNIEFDEIVDFSPYVVGENIKKNNDLNGSKKMLLYKLYAVIHHNGQLNGGHYTAHSFVESQNKWFFFNDTVVKESTQQAVHQSSAYILFYQRIDDDDKKDDKQNH